MVSEILWNHFKIRVYTFELGGTVGGTVVILILSSVYFIGCSGGYLCCPEQWSSICPVGACWQISSCKTPKTEELFWPLKDILL